MFENQYRSYVLANTYMRQLAEQGCELGAPSFSSFASVVGSESRWRQIDDEATLFADLLNVVLA